jgi:ferritin-like protein
MGTTYHEPFGELPEETCETHRALTSLIEELEAVDWYHQRSAVTGDEALKAVLIHNRDEEIEHAAMCLEYLRRVMPKFDEELNTYLFTSGPITGIEEASVEEEGTNPGGGLGIGNKPRGT